ncbi:peptide-N(4)-(N-acetyl-beta-glucosaminyl)asparagine amidase-like isoform X1 [Leptotrombidium deliense]|uniref:Peptide-N(4)-(N-acetyl-beta-glucosaminyl)asparagine amidase n=1 Tax=Leptotrombidium deliense TaxID=299467 RepID=A0A443SCD2_9ACAR|nr:peptide-N(4)-(N-acetyl-beta-glucosaminyl)asparagine amidase-like isoform X1 [Leptotrombidium deliense]
MAFSSSNRESIFRQLNLISSEKDLQPKNEAERHFLKQLLSYVRRVLLYEDQKLREKVNRVVPVKELLEKAMRKRDLLKKENNLEIDTRDLFLVELLAWFKNSFFSWFDVPVCSRCSNSKMKFVEYQTPNAEDVKNDASRVEGYACSCGAKSRFPRYNNPLKLLETRKGRCGEWANCFCAILHSLDYEVRFILDSTDHVWAEVYSTTEKRWMHCDPCENAIDTPLLYEHGWNKKLIYCLAFSFFEVQDVTWRYTTQIDEILQRRSNCRESWIIDVLMKISAILQQHLPNDKKEYLCERRLKELVEFLFDPNQKRTVKESERHGRQSGSLLWRLQRGEASSNTTMFTFEISESNNKIVYNCVKDEYSFGDKTFEGWSKCVYRFNNVFRKEENDWKMCYLSRRENSIPGEGVIEWNINLSKVKWTSIEIFLMSETYSNGVVDVSAVTLPDNKVLPLKTNTRNKIERKSVDNCDTLLVTTKLRGGTSQVGWQHAQLFRQSLLKDREKNSFEINITMN